MKMSNNLSQFQSIMKRKKAQVGGTLTWFVATIIIIFILLIAVYAASILGKTKSLGEKITREEEKDWEDVKNDIAFEKNSTNKDKIQKWLNNKTLSEDS